MESTVLMKRVWHDGKVFAHTKEEMKVVYPIYTLFRHTDNVYPSFYTIVCQYGNGECNNFLYDDIRKALRVYRALVD